jgi:hypothetical protein
MTKRDGRLWVRRVRGPGRREGGGETMGRKAEEWRLRALEARIRKVDPNWVRPEESNPVKTGTIYFIQVGEDGPIKIGRTEGSPLSRLRSMQTAMPFELRVVAYIPDVPLSREGEIHQLFDHLHLRGEWFEPAPEIWEYIKIHGRAWNADAAVSATVAKAHRDEGLTKEQRQRRAWAAIRDHHRPGVKKSDMYYIEEMAREIARTDSIPWFGD